jgi:hypothetical protein
MSRDEVTYVPFQSMPTDVGQPVDRPTSSRSAASIGIALLPAIEFCLLLALFSVDAQSVAVVTIVTIAALGQVVAFLFAAGDQRRLAELGLVRRTPAIIALVCPTAYLLIRGNRAHGETYTGLGPAWLNLATLVAVGVTFFASPLTLHTLDTLNSIAHTQQ